ncbi:MAG: exo-alpha-sialidase [Verrucomicrobiales bacterium]|nr:exo-alpha-sialidase [Verrucomicrobiales bacterium]
MSENPILSPAHEEKLTTLARALVDQEKARVIVEPQDRSTGFWFGGGNVVRDPGDGSFLICGRYRNYGDSRTGTGAGARGLECAIFRGESPDGEFEKIHSWSKQDVECDGVGVVSIEGTALHIMPNGAIELFISTEKDNSYPDDISSFQKPGTGVWAIDRISADKVQDLSPEGITEIVPNDHDDYGRLHCKDPWTFDLNGDLVLGYCTHPFTWSSSGTAIRVRNSGSDDYKLVTKDMLSRGPVWDIAAARVTERLAVPQVGAFADLPPLSLYFYDSCENLRQLDENPTAVARPRGWSCEELGGIAVGFDSDFPNVQSISRLGPLFVSPHGTGCSRYVATCRTDDGVFTNWQQSQKDLSQPLVGTFLEMGEVETILG